MTGVELSCSTCVCQDCLMWWSRRCPYGGCWDNERARVNPWPGPVRKSWSDWDQPGEQRFWCRGGAFYPVGHCDRYIHYERDKAVVQDCLEAAVVKYQDGYIQCSMLDVYGCEVCYRHFEAKTEGGED